MLCSVMAGGNIVKKTAEEEECPLWVQANARVAAVMAARHRVLEHDVWPLGYQRVASVPGWYDITGSATDWVMTLVYDGPLSPLGEAYYGLGHTIKKTIVGRLPSENELDQPTRKGESYYMSKMGSNKFYAIDLPNYDALPYHSTQRCAHS